MSELSTRSGEHVGPAIDHKDGYEVINCEVCGFAHVMPIPSETELEAYYRRTFYEQERKKDYIQLQQQQQSWWTNVYADRLAQFERVRGRKGRILDVGCGPGFFLAYAEAQGWETVGIEPSEKASQFAISILRGDVHCCELGQLQQEQIGAVDVVYSHGVLEHMREPDQFLGAASDLLPADGLIFASVANDYSPVQQVLREVRDFPSWWLVPPEHINYFNTESFPRFVEGAGFEVVDMKTTFPMEFFLLMGDDYVAQPELGKAAHQRRVNFEQAWRDAGKQELLDEFYRALGKLGMGRQIEVVARRGR